MHQRTRSALVRSYYEYVDAEAYESLLDLFADDVTYVRPGHPSLDGIEAFERFYREERPLDEGNHSVDEIVHDGETVAVQGRFDGLQDGDRVSFGFADFHRFDEDDLITERRTYTDRDTV